MTIAVAVYTAKATTVATGNLKPTPLSMVISYTSSQQAYILKAVAAKPSASPSVV